MALIRFPNLAQTTMTGAGIGVGGASFTVTSAGAFGAADFIVRAEDAVGGLPAGTGVEFMRVTNVAGSTFTVTKGLGGTADQAHPSGSFVTAVLTNEALTLGLVQQLLHASGGTTIFTPGGGTGGQGTVTFSDTPTWAGLVTTALGFRDSRGQSGFNVPMLFAKKNGDGTTNKVSFTAIPQTFSRARLSWSARTTSGTNGQDIISAQYNTDGGANYFGERINGNTAAVVAQDGGVLTTALSIGFVAGGGTTANFYGHGNFELTDYASTASIKGGVGVSQTPKATGATNSFIDFMGGNWNSTAAITQIDVLCASGFWTTSSTFWLDLLP